MDRHAVFLISAGRTGTRFFGELLHTVIEDCYSCHEPDAVNLREWEELIKKIRIFGVKRLFLDKLMGTFGARNLTNNYLSGTWDLPKSVEEFCSQRERILTLAVERLYIESNQALFGLIPVISKAFERSKIVVVIRDPRDWVRSVMNFETIYGRRDHQWWRNKRLDPFLVQDKIHMREWREYDKFKKLVWYYRTVYANILERSRIQGLKIYRYEDLFLAPDKYDHLRDFLEFVTHFDKRVFHYRIPRDFLEKKVHVNISYKFPRWPAWSTMQAKFLYDMCGRLMETFHYGTEREWVDLIS